jgi:hypothetical protein
MAKSKSIYQAPAPKEHTAFTAEITRMGQEMQALSAETHKLTDAFAGIVGKIPVLGSFVKSIGDILTVRSQFGKILEGIPKLFGYGGSGSAGGGGLDSFAKEGAAIVDTASAAGPIGMIAASAVVAGVALYTLGEKAIATGFAFAEIANPATVNLYNRAVLDAEAALGQKMTPAIEVATNVMQGVGDFFVEILPSTSEFRDQLMQLNPAIDEVKGIARDLAPTIKTVFATGVQIAGEGLKIFAQRVQDAVKWVRDLTGIKIGEGPQGNARGMAAGNATVGDVESVSRNMFQAALEQGRKDEPAQQSANYLAEISKFLTDKAAPLWGEFKVGIDSMKGYLDTIAGFTTGSLATFLAGPLWERLSGLAVYLEILFTSIGPGLQKVFH